MCTAVKVTTFHTVIRYYFNINLMPRFMHLFSMAGMAEQMCKYGAGDKVLQLDNLDPFGFAEHYGVTEKFSDINDLISRAIELEPEYDYVIIHDFADFKHHFTPSKIIFVFHGSKLRNMAQKDIEKYSEWPCYVTTQDLLEYMPKASYLPNMVDLELFYDDIYDVEDTRTYLCINRKRDRKHIEKTIRMRYPDIEYLERTEGNIIRYTDMPDFLSQYTDYVDWKFDYSDPPLSLPNPSCTGLQALALGMDVHDKDGNLLDRNLLIVHGAKYVVERFLQNYDTNLD